MGRRVRKYIDEKNFSLKTPIWNAIKKYGINDFNVSIGILPNELADVPDMCWVAEQY
jgi:hypothetical protein